MKNTYTILFTALLTISGVTFAHAATTNCTDQTSNPYAYACSDSSTYEKGQLITFTLNQSKIPLFIGPQQHPWHVVDSTGKTIYTPPSVSPTTQPTATFHWTDTWNQINDKGKQVKKGTYSIIFSTMPYNVPPLNVTVTKKTK